MERELRAVLVGCGRISAAWLRSAQAIEGLRIVGLVDLREEAARERAAEFGLGDALVSDDLEAVLARTAPDLVFNCTVPAAHADVAVAALRRGCHVLGEKPLADSLDAARRMIAAAEEAGRLLAVTQNRRYNRYVRRLRRLVCSGALGPLTTIDNDYAMAIRFPGFRVHLRHMELLELAIHHFDIARCIAGADPVEVYCKEWNPAGSYYDHGAAVRAIFGMSDGVVFSYRGSVVAEGLDTDNEGAWRVTGQRGTAVWDGFEHVAAEVVVEAGFRSTYRALPVPDDDEPGKTGGHLDVIREFVDCVRTGRTPETAAADNVKSLAMVLAAIESAERGQPVPVRW